MRFHPVLQPVFAFFIIEHASRRVIHFNVTSSPSDAQQLREATPFSEGPRFLIRDRDDKYGTKFKTVANGAGIRILKTAVRAPLMNAICERFIGSVRRECLDQIIILGEDHLRRVLKEYVRYFADSRPHQGLNQRTPSQASGRYVTEATNGEGEVLSIPVLGGLHHEYRRAA